MNRILFLPLNRQLLYFARRTFLKGHKVCFKVNPGNVRAGWKSENFVDHRELCKYYLSFEFTDKRDWFHYLLAKKINHVVTNVEDNKEIIHCLKAAKQLGIKTSYVMHGGGKIYDYDFQKNWYTSGIYDYFYAKDNYTKNYIGPPIARKFTRKPLDYSDASYFKWQNNEPKKVLFVPSQTSPEWYLEGSGLLLGNDEKAIYQSQILDVMEELKDIKFYWCHDKSRDAVPNKLIGRLLALGKYSNVKWVSGRSEKYFDKVDACMTDVGSSFFFNAIRARKPVLCLHHIRNVPFKRGTMEMFGDCIKFFNSELKYELWKFVTSKMIDYIPHNYIRTEQEPNDPLVWEER